MFHVCVISVEWQKLKGYSKSAMLYKYCLKLILVYSVYLITLSNFSIFSQTSLKWVYRILWVHGILKMLTGFE